MLSCDITVNMVYSPSSCFFYSRHAVIGSG